MRRKALDLAVLVTSLLGRLEWSGHAEFLAQSELTVLRRLGEDPWAVLHPFTVLPLLGQVLLLVSLARRTPGRVLSLLGIGLLSVLLGLLAVIGVVSARPLLTLSTLPFLASAGWAVREHLRAPR